MIAILKAGKKLLLVEAEVIKESIKKCLNSNSVIPKEFMMVTRAS
jgi:hypothetical protein